MLIKSRAQAFLFGNDFFTGETIFFCPLWYAGGYPFLDLAFTSFKGDSQSFHRDLTILKLASIFRGLGNNTGRQMANAYGGISCVAMLAARTGAPVELDLYVCFLYFNHFFSSNCFARLALKNCPVI